jgi:hypothetical protein
MTTRSLKVSDADNFGSILQDEGAYQKAALRFLTTPSTPCYEMPYCELQNFV